MRGETEAQGRESDFSEAEPGSEPEVVLVFALLAQGGRRVCTAGPTLPSPALSAGPRTVETTPPQLQSQNWEHACYF